MRRFRKQNDAKCETMTSTKPNAENLKLEFDAWNQRGKFELEFEAAGKNEAAACATQLG